MFAVIALFSIDLFNNEVKPWLKPIDRRVRCSFTHAMHAMKSMNSVAYSHGLSVCVCVCLVLSATLMNLIYMSCSILRLSFVTKFRPDCPNHFSDLLQSRRRVTWGQVIRRHCISETDGLIHSELGAVELMRYCVKELIRIKNINATKIFNAN